MKVFRAKSAEYHHIFGYGYPGCGKTKLIGDYHNAGQSVAIVAGYNTSRTLELQGVDCPIIVPSSLDELIAIVQLPEEVEEKIIHPVFPGYKVKTWAFDILKDLQMIIFGEGGRPKSIIFDGDMELPVFKPTGIMSIGGSLQDDGSPTNKAYRILDMRLRSLLRSVEKMQYHTIITAHAEKDYTPEVVKRLTGDPKIDKDLKAEAVMTGYPALEGFSAKSDISGLAGEMLLYLESPRQTEYFIYPKPHPQGFHARTQMAEHLPPRIDWTNKNAFELLSKLVKEAKRG